MNKKFYKILFLILTMVYFCQDIKAAVTTIQLTPASPTTMSTGAGYYLAGKTYDFKVRVVDPAGFWGGAGTVVLNIPSSTAINVTASSITGVGACTLTVNTGTVSGTAVVDAGGTTNDFTVTISITFLWNTPERTWASGTMTATSTLVDSQTTSYGVCSTIALLGGVFTGVAADGYVNPWHTAFDLQGSEIVYNVSGAAAADAVRLVADAGAGEITSSELLVGGSSIGAVDADESAGSPNLIYTVGAASIGSTGVLALTIRASMATGGTTEVSSNSYSLTCDSVRITNIQFIGGGGIDSPYFRSIPVTGVRIRVTAQMNATGTAMVGNTTIKIRDTTDTIDYNILIPAGSNQAEITIDNSALATPVVGSTAVHSYATISATGGAYDDEQDTDLGNGSSFAGSPSQSCYWDNQDPPGANIVTFTSYTGTGVTNSAVYQIEFGWNADFTADANDQDFYSYRIHYKDHSTTTPWYIVDRSTSGYGAGGYELQDRATTSVTITGLSPLTQYDFYISAVDVFGNEVDSANRISGIATTNASQITATITDGITSYDDNSFTSNASASARVLRDSSIKVDFTLSPNDEQPDSMNIIVAADGATDLVVSNAVNTALVQNTDYYVYTCYKTGATEWTAYIPESIPIMVSGGSVKFVLELIKSGASAFSDHNDDTEPAPGDPNNYEWTFSVNTNATFTPWPVRILNNVITSSNPTAYPSYYLSAEALVSIKVYDIKGRLLIVLLDNARRPAGQNIKENGWRGVNKAGKKLGIGLYYMKFKAKRITDGKVILNSVKKVVMAR